jgi:hypothetical protein
VDQPDDAGFPGGDAPFHHKRALPAVSRPTVLVSNPAGLSTTRILVPEDDFERHDQGRGSS